MAREYRSRNRILLDLLRAIKRQPDIGPGSLLASANLNSDRLDTYLEEAVGRGLVAAAAAPRRSFRLTEKGQRLLTELDRLDRFMADFGMTL